MTRKKVVCSSRPDCPCNFCVQSRLEIAERRTAKDQLDAIAEAWIAEFTFRRDREMDAEAYRRGFFPRKLDGDLFTEANA